MRCFNCNELLENNEEYYSPEDSLYSVPMCEACAPQHWTATPDDFMKVWDDIIDDWDDIEVDEDE